MKSRIEILSFLAAAAVAVAGCGSEEPLVPVSAPAPTQANTLSLEAPAHQNLPPVIDEAIAAGEEAQAVAPAVASDSVTPEVVDVNINLIQEAVYNYQQSTRSTPSTVEQLVQGRFLARAPKAPDGKKYVIDPKTLQVTSASR